MTGGLDLWPADPAIPQADYTGSLSAEGVPFELLDAAEITRRWPVWRLTDDVTGVWQAHGGIADPYRGNAAHRRLAAERGATLLDRTPVDAVRAAGGAYEVDAGGTTYGAGRVVIAADAWTNELLAHFERRLPLTVTKEQVTYFARTRYRSVRAGSVPRLDLDGRPVVLRLPDVRRGRPQGRPGLRRPAGRPRRRARSTRTRPSAPAFAASSRAAAVGLGPPIYTKTCLYTMTPERDFVLDRLPDAPGVVVGLGAAHGFKFASVIGRILVELALDGASPSDGELGAFRIDRPALLAADPPLRPDRSERPRHLSDPRVRAVPCTRPRRVRRYRRFDRRR